MDRLRHRVRLYRAANSERSDGGKACEQNRQPFLLHAALNVIHRAARHFAFAVLNAVFHRQHTLAVFGGHTENRGNPHPKYRTRSADNHSSGHARNITRTDGGRKCRHQCAKMRNIAFLCFTFGFLLRGKSLFQSKRQQRELYAHQTYR